MLPSDRPLALAVALLVVLAGCSGLAPPETGTPTETPPSLTPTATTPATATSGTSAPPTDPRPTPTPTATPAPTSDRDGDGFTACEERRLLDDANPERMDVYVEIDWTAGARPSREDLRALVAVYDDAPVHNPNGDPGVDLHLVYDDELPARDRPLPTFNVTDYAGHFDNDGRGYHYALFVERVAGNALGRGVRGTILVQRAIPDRSPTLYVNVFAHELGHSLGLTRRVFTGVDNFSLPFRRYPSVMSQVGVFETLRLSDGTHHEDDFDDWGYLDENLFTPDTSRLANESSAC